MLAGQVTASRAASELMSLPLRIDTHGLRRVHEQVGVVVAGTRRLVARVAPDNLAEKLVPIMRSQRRLERDGPDPAVRVPDIREFDDQPTSRMQHPTQAREDRFEVVPVSCKALLIPVAERGVRRTGEDEVGPRQVERAQVCR